MPLGRYRGAEKESAVGRLSKPQRSARELAEWKNAKRVTLVGGGTVGFLTTLTLVATAPVAATTIASPSATKPVSVPRA